jgi:hypothetical protein
MGQYIKYSALKNDIFWFIKNNFYNHGQLNYLYNDLRIHEEKITRITKTILRRNKDK